ncbi:MAG: recombination mediator RecR [Bacteriovoracia bacterium]
MLGFPPILQNAIDQMAKLPGVGKRTALRYILSLSNWKQDQVLALSDALRDLIELKHCSECGLFAEKDVCEICQNTARSESRILCIVEQITDAMAIENSGRYQGLFHVLGGVLNPLAGIGPDELNLDQVSDRVARLKIQEIILAINPSVEGDATCAYIKQQLAQLENSSEIKISRIGFGVPMGGNLEYLDPLTISKALENKTNF